MATHESSTPAGEAGGQAARDVGRHRPVSSTPVRRAEKLSESVAREIMRSIVEAELPPDTMLPSERDMLVQYKVSRTSLREALRLLEVQGIIRLRTGPGGGPIVEARTAQALARTLGMHLYYAKATIRDLMEARLVIEPLMASLAANRNDPAVGEIIEVLLEETADPATAAEPITYVEVTQRFHDHVCSMSGNVVLDSVASGLKSLYQDRVRELRLPEEVRVEVLREHEAIAIAIRDGDAPKAADLMRGHMNKVAVAAYERLPGLVDDLITW